MNNRRCACNRCEYCTYRRRYEKNRERILARNARQRDAVRLARFQAQAVVNRKIEAFLDGELSLSEFRRRLASGADD